MAATKENIRKMMTEITHGLYMGYVTKSTFSRAWERLTELASRGPVGTVHQGDFTARSISGNYVYRGNDNEMFDYLLEKAETPVLIKYIEDDAGVWHTVPKFIEAYAKGEIAEMTAKEENTPWIPTDFVPHNFVMDPETDDILLNGDRLKVGMIVLIESVLLKTDLSRNDEYSKRRALENNRWAKVVEIGGINREVISFIVEYSDGVKKSRSYDRSYSWVVKKDSLPKTDDTAMSNRSAGELYVEAVDAMRAYSDRTVSYCGQIYSVSESTFDEVLTQVRIIMMTSDSSVEHAERYARRLIATVLENKGRIGR